MYGFSVYGSGTDENLAIFDGTSWITIDFAELQGLLGLAFKGSPRLVKHNNDYRTVENPNLYDRGKNIEEAVEKIAEFVELAKMAKENSIRQAQQVEEFKRNFKPIPNGGNSGSGYSPDGSYFSKRQWDKTNPKKLIKSDTIFFR